MKNEEKADKICEKYGVSKLLPTNEECIAYSAAMEMAEWKDEKVKSCFILISKLIKDGILKDNPEHIMIEQMMELYNNLKI